MSHVLLGKFKMEEQDLLYMPPELVLGQPLERSETVSLQDSLMFKVDVWNLGVLLLLCISPSFEYSYQSVDADVLKRIH